MPQGIEAVLRRLESSSSIRSAFLTYFFSFVFADIRCYGIGSSPTGWFPGPEKLDLVLLLTGGIELSTLM